MAVGMSLMRRAPSSDHDSFRTAVEAGDRARDTGSWPEAVRAYRLALQLDPAALHIATQLGHALKETGDFAGAEDAYGRYLAARPSDADIHLQLGHLFNRQNRLDVAEGWFEKALGLDKEGSVGLDASRELAHLRVRAGDDLRRKVYDLMSRRRYDEARGLLTELVSGGAEDLVGLLGNACKELGRFEEAEAWYRRYHLFAATASADVRFDSELQSGHLYQLA
jgi:tetratricopeptide (TPR) repeat protein